MTALIEAGQSRTSQDESVTLQDRIGAQLERVVAELGLHRAALEVFRQLTGESLAGIDATGPLPRFSTINNDGMPFQYAVSMGGSEPGMAYLTEVGVPGSSVPARIDRTRASLATLLPRAGLAGASLELDRALREFLPTSADELAHWRGGIWVAVGCGHHGIGLKVYVNARRQAAEDGWHAVLGLLRFADRPRSEAALSALMARFVGFVGVAVPAGVAIALAPGGLGTLKVYARLDRWRWELLADVLRQTGHRGALPVLRHFGRKVGAAKTGRPGSLVLSLEFPADDGDLDVKLDACAHCRYEDEAAARAATLSLAADFDLSTDDYTRVLSAIQDARSPGPGPLQHHAFLGLGLSHREPVRLNVYLKPVLASPSPDRRPNPGPWPVRSVGSSLEHRLDAALSLGLSFVLDSQSRSGAWVDFALPPGPSDGWVTAYVGHTLTETLRDSEEVAVREVAVQAAVDRALAWSAYVMRPDYRWGFNAFTESDADTSAWTILFLRANAWRVPSQCASALASFQRRDGGYATFRELAAGDSWMDGHADVTPIAVRALRELGAADLADSSRLSVAQAQTEAGSWNAFWWTTPWYSTWANLSLVEPAGWSYNRAAAAAWVSIGSVPDAPFEVALALRSCVLLSDAIQVVPSRIRSLAETLCATQDEDGSWASRPMLRLTAARAHQPWSSPESGRVYADPRRIFTTATAIAALREARSAISGASRR